MGQLKNKQILVSSNFNINNQKLINVTDPTESQDVATKIYVDQNLSGITSLSTSLSSEVSIRSSVDTSLSTVISIISGATLEMSTIMGDDQVLGFISGSLTGVSYDTIVSSETSTRISDVLSLSTAISSNSPTGITSLSTSLSSEISNRTDADLSLSTVISIISGATLEMSTIMGDDQVLGFISGSLTGVSYDTIVSTEASIRTSDVLSLSTVIASVSPTSITSLSTSLSSEISTRTSADTSLSTQVSSEISRSTSLTTRISTEISTRTGADTSLSTQISSTIVAVGEANDNAIAAAFTVNPNMVNDGYRMISGNIYPYDSQYNIVYLESGKTYTFSARGRRVNTVATKLEVDLWEDSWTSVSIISFTETTLTTKKNIFIPSITGNYHVGSFSWPSGNSGYCETLWYMLQEGDVYVDENTLFKQTYWEEVENIENLLEDSEERYCAATASITTSYYILSTAEGNGVNKILEHGKLYTFSVESATLSNSGTTYSVLVHNFTAGYTIDYDEFNTASKSSITFRVPDGTDDVTVILYTGLNGAANNISATWYNIMVQYGPFSTPWKPISISVAWSGSVGSDTQVVTADGTGKIVPNSGMMITSGGTVGIGTTTPGEKLSIDGNITIKEGGWYKMGTLSSSSNVVGIGHISGQGMMFDVYKTSGGGSLATDSMDAMFIQQTTGNVGIGTTAPTEKLEIKDVNPKIIIGDTTPYETWNNTSLGELIFKNHYNLYENTKIYAWGDFGSTSIYPDLRFQTQTVDRLTIKGINGNVGIGTMSPRSVLHIQQDKDDGQFTIGRSSNSNEQLLIGFHSGDYGVIQAVEQGVAFRNLSLNPLGGNVGIGTISPAAKLEVSGSGWLQYWSNPNTQSSGIYAYEASPNVPSIAFGDGTGWKFHIAKASDANTKFVTVVDTGNVGIGTTSPSSLLEVVGGETGKIKIANTTNTYGSAPQLSFSQYIDVGQTEVAKIYTFETNGNNNNLSDALYFATVQRSTLTMTDRIIIDNEGVVRMISAKVDFIGGSNYNENIRMHANSVGWSSLVIGAVDGDGGTGVGQWGVVRYPNEDGYKFAIRHNTDDHLSITTDGIVMIYVTTPILSNFRFQEVGGAVILGWGNNSSDGWIIGGTGSVSYLRPCISGSEVNTTDLTYRSSGWSFSGANVGIGTTSPDYTLQVNGTIAPESSGQDLGTTSLRWDLYASTVNTTNITTSTSDLRYDNSTSRTIFSFTTPTTITSSGRLTLSSDGQLYLQSTGGIKADLESGTFSKMVGFNTVTKTLTYSDIQPVTKDTNGTIAPESSGQDLGTTSLRWDLYGGTITTTGDITANTSDKRLKTSIIPIENALVKVQQLNGFTYLNNDLSHKLAGLDTTIRRSGVFAQEVQEVLPEAVRPAPFDTDDDGNSISGENYLTVQYEKIVPLLIEAIKDLKKEIDELKKLIQ